MSIAMSVTKIEVPERALQFRQLLFPRLGQPHHQAKTEEEALKPPETGTLKLASLLDEATSSLSFQKKERKAGDTNRYLGLIAPFCIQIGQPLGSDSGDGVGITYYYLAALSHRF